MHLLFVALAALATIDLTYGIEISVPFKEFDIGIRYGNGEYTVASVGYKLQPKAYDPRAVLHPHTGDVLKGR
jgi:hypothetical protein